MKKTLILGILLSSMATAPLANETNASVLAMSESGRRTFAGMLVRQSGGTCPAISRTFFQGTLDKNNAVWNVTCTPKDSFAIVFYDDSARTTRVLKCSELKALGAPDCFKKF